MSRFSRRALLGAAALSSLARPALAAFPDQAIRVIVPWNAGGLADILMRSIAPEMGRLLGQPVVIENRAGANGAVGTQAVARANADGHALILGNAETHAINPLVYPRLVYNAVADFTPVTVFANGPFVLITKQTLGADTLDAFIALARAQRGRLTFASWGIGSTSHLAMELLIQSERLEMVHVPFTGAAPATTALLGGQVDCMFLNAGPAEASARDGRLKILGVGAAARIPLLPNTPTLAELGKPIDAANWFGLLAPARLPASVAERIAQVTAEALRPANVQEIFRVQAALPVTLTPQQTGAFIVRDREKWEPVVRSLNIRLE